MNFLLAPLRLAAGYTTFFGLLLVAAGLFITPNVTAGAGVRPFHEDVTAFLKKVVTPDGQVNYTLAARDAAALQALVQRVQTFDVYSAKPAERKAFYLNAYNVLVVRAVVHAYPVASVMKLPGFFDKQEYNVAGELLTLNELETNKLRKPYADPRIHFALVCGARSCPRLRSEAYVPASLEAQLNDQTRKVLQDPLFIRLDAGGKKVLVSEIFKWYALDFKNTGKSTVAYINQFRRVKIPVTAVPDYYAYDWALNDQK
ncbi:DUF547 domain-containing protein [Hymenobacter tibetensis]|uniref:DUF547 domain-containing protein n=1 Tax=Hymenobacter tibetensis TaxID=497967 RepID=A0ABY4D2X9_9BACT|nr:DUF547 domain-containing protein [Hymenobacter tibetensis]UOG76893.1 DUF547 domain-containing protein [Hymenobacter tibetensis]